MCARTVSAATGAPGAPPDGPGGRAKKPGLRARARGCCFDSMSPCVCVCVCVCVCAGEEPAGRHPLLLPAVSAQVVGPQVLFLLLLYYIILYYIRIGPHFCRRAAHGCYCCCCCCCGCRYLFCLISYRTLLLSARAITAHASQRPAARPRVCPRAHAAPALVCARACVHARACVRVCVSLSPPPLFPPSLGSIVRLTRSFVRVCVCACVRQGSVVRLLAHHDPQRHQRVLQVVRGLYNRL